MEMENKKIRFHHQNPHKNRVHGILAHSYLFYFVSFLFGLFLDFMFPVQFYEKVVMAPIGAIFLVFGTLLIFWAQKSSHKLQKENIIKETFCCGPYRYTRSPTHFGLFFLMLGFGIIVNALFVIIFTIISFFITKFIFLKREEKILVEKYGAPYVEYQKSVRF
jgi:protein-S-isoprenylcysteine O-methyltransferase Ste14